MKFIIFLLFSILFISSCSNLFYQKMPYSFPFPLEINGVYLGMPAPIEFRNKPIKEIRFYLDYESKPSEEEKQQERFIILYKNCLIDNAERKNPHKFCDIEVRQKDKIQFQRQSYCYDIDKYKESVFKESLKAKLYDKAGNILDEDYIRCGRYLDGVENCDEKTHSYLIFYLPYLKQAHKIKIIKQETDQEITLNEKELLSYQEIKESNNYFEWSNCHIIRIDPWWL